MWGNLSLCDQRLKSSTFGKHCTISKGSSNRKKSRSRCLRWLVGMLNFSLMMEYFIPLASTFKQAVCSLRLGGGWSSLLTQIYYNMGLYPSDIDVSKFI